MLYFGVKSEFLIQYYPYSERYKDDPDFIENPKNYLLGGSVYFWVNGKNIFAFKDLGPEATYGFFDLTIITEFFCNYLFYHVTHDPFPTETKSKTGIDMMEEVKLVEGPDNDITKYIDVDWDNVDMELRDKIYDWNCRHGFIPNNGGTFLPDGYIQKVDNQIEISWRNEFPYESGDHVFYAEHKEGVEYIDVKLYRDTIVAFCMEILSRMEQIYPKRAAEFRENLQKAIDVKL